MGHYFRFPFHVGVGVRLSRSIGDRHLSSDYDIMTILGNNVDKIRNQMTKKGRLSTTLLKALFVFGCVFLLVSVFGLSSLYSPEPCDCKVEILPETTDSSDKNIIIEAIDALVQESQQRPEIAKAVEKHEQNLKVDNVQGDNPEWGTHKLCVLVPFRDRFEEMMVFIPHMDKFLSAQKVRHKILIINQIDELRFNRASLINVGYLMSVHKSAQCDYIAMHDVDLLPKNPELHYKYPADGPLHIAAPELHPKYHYPTFVGGIMLLSTTHFSKINGMSNRFWGWGREDDEFYARLQENKLEIQRPKNITTDSKTTFIHLHSSKKRSRDYKRYGKQHQDSKKRDRVGGVKDIKYDIKDIYDTTVDGSTASVINVELKCDFDDTPWCAHKEDLERQKLKAEGKLPPEKEREVFFLPGGVNH